MLFNGYGVSIGGFYKPYLIISFKVISHKFHHISNFNLTNGIKPIHNKILNQKTIVELIKIEVKVF